MTVCISFEFHAQIMARLPVWKGRDWINLCNFLLLHNSTAVDILDLIRIIDVTFQILVIYFLECVADEVFLVHKNVSAIPAAFPKYSWAAIPV